MGELTEKTVLVTGGTKGIGLAIAVRAAERGADVVLGYGNDRDAADSAVAQISRMGRKAVAFRSDFSSEAGVSEFFEKARLFSPSIDCLVNSAGVFRTGDLADISEEEFRWHFSVNVFGLAFAIRGAVELFPWGGGSVVNIGSSVSSFTPAGSVVYNASKGAVDAITRTLANELGPKGIRVNSVNPGLTQTPGMQRSEFSSPEFKQRIEALTPLRRIGNPTDIAGAVCFLMSDDSSWITGETLVVGGGLH